MLTDEEQRRAARMLLAAEKSRQPVTQLSRTFPGLEIADAYRIQDFWAEARSADGARVVGHKIGLTSRAMQMVAGIGEPDYGRILDDAMFTDGARIDAGRFIKPRIEVELSFILAEDLAGPG